MKSKKWIKIFFGLSLISLLFVGGTNFVVDPFQQYRVKTFYPVAFTNQRYKNAGFAKNFEYDSLILGTSMTENFLIDEVEKELNFNKLLKLSISGGSAKEQSTTLETAITNNKNLKNVLWGLDIFSFVGETDTLRYGINSFPFYLYDENKFNDYRYLLSLDTLKDSYKAVSKAYLKNDKFVYDYNKMYQWQHKFEKQFSMESLMKSWKERENFVAYEKNKQSFFYLKNSFDANFLSLIKNNPQINFKIFFPPYSILTLKYLEEKNQIDDVLKFKKYIFDNLSVLENVKIYDFQVEEKVTQNLNNYKDLSHYHQKINSWMIQQIKENNYLLTNENIDENLQNFKKQAKEYDFPKIEIESMRIN